MVAEASARLDRFLAGERRRARAEPARGGGGDGRPEPETRAASTRFARAFRPSRTPPSSGVTSSRLALFEDAGAVEREAWSSRFGEEVPLQDAASYLGALLGNRTAPRCLLGRGSGPDWDEVEKRVGGAPMLLRRVVEAVGQLLARRHLEEATAFFAEHPVAAARQAIAQTLERMRQDVELWERAEPAVARWLEAR